MIKAITGFFTPNILDRIKLIALALVLTALGVLLYLNQGLRADNKTLAAEVATQAALVAARDKTIAARDLYIAKTLKAKKANTNFLVNQTKTAAGIKKNAPIDIDILGPDFFNGLCRNKDCR